MNKWCILIIFTLAISGAAIANAAFNLSDDCNSKINELNNDIRILNDIITVKNAEIESLRLPAVE